MAEEYLIGVDGGSQSTKVLIFNKNGDVVCSATEPLKPMVARKPGYVEHPEDDLWDSLKVALKKAMAEFKGDVKDIKGLGLCTIRCCRAFMRSDGSLAEPVMSWMDVRSYETFQDSEHISYTCPPSGYITHRLTGELADSAANAFQWQFPLDMDTWEWSKDKEYFDSFKIPEEKLLRLQMPGTVLGYVTKKAALETGLPEGLAVVATANDKAVEALGSGLIRDNLGFISLGTYIASMVCGDEHRPAPEGYWTNLSCVPNRYLYESNGIRRGMWHISWFKSIIGEELAKKADGLGIPVEALLEKEALEVPAGSDGLMTIPDWLAPANQLHRKGVMIGFDERHTRGHMYRSIMEGIACTLKGCYNDMINELGIKPDEIIIAGGGSNSDLFMQIFADIYGVKTVRNKINGAAALGAAISAAVATGVYGGFEEAADKMVKREKEFHPDAQNHNFYNNIAENIYFKLPGLLEDTLKTAHGVFGR